MPLAAPPPPPSASPDAPPPAPDIDQVILDLTPVPPAACAAAKAGPSNLAARIGLVLALVVALAGVVSAVAKSGDDGKPTTTASAGTRPNQADDAEDPLEASTPAEIPAGFEVRQGKGLSLAVPADWQSLDAGDLQSILDGEALDQAVPDLDPSVRDAMQGAIDHGALFMAIDTSGPDGGRNINALRVLGEAPLDDLFDEVKAEYEQAGFPVQVLGSERRDTALGDSLRISIRGTIGGRDVEVIQYYVPFDGHTYIVTGTGTDDIVDQAIQTLRVGDAV
jgi:hypothetical protein